MDWLTNFFNPLIGGLPNVIQAVLLLIVAWIFAAIIKSLVVGAMRRIFEKKEGMSSDMMAAKDDTINLIGRIVYALVFFLFLPGALDKLGMNNVSAPIAQMVSQFLNFLPNIIAAGIVLAFGAFLSKLVQQVLSMALQKTKLDEVTQKYNGKGENAVSVSQIIAKIVYALIMIIFVIAAIQILNIKAISEPAMGMINQIFGIIPLIFAAFILIAFGVFLANLCAQLLEGVLANTGMDQYIDKTFPKKSAEGRKPASTVIAVVVKVVINIFFIVSGIKILNIEVLSNIGTAIIGYMPSVLAAIIVLGLASFAAGWAEKLILKGNSQATVTAFAAKAGIMVLAFFMAFSQLGIAKDIVNELFIAIVAAIAVAFAVSFGLGGKEFAKRSLDKLEENHKDKD